MPETTAHEVCSDLESFQIPSIPGLFAEDEPDATAVRAAKNIHLFQVATNIAGACANGFTGFLSGSTCVYGVSHLCDTPVRHLSAQLGRRNINDDVRGLLGASLAQRLSKIAMAEQRANASKAAAEARTAKATGSDTVSDPVKPKKPKKPKGQKKDTRKAVAKKQNVSEWQAAHVLSDSDKWLHGFLNKSESSATMATDSLLSRIAGDPLFNRPRRTGERLFIGFQNVREYLVVRAAIARLCIRTAPIMQRIPARSRPMVPFSLPACLSRVNETESRQFHQRAASQLSLTGRHTAIPRRPVINQRRHFARR
jgi:hypothetical protein